MTDERSKPEEEAQSNLPETDTAEETTTADDPLKKVAGAMITAAGAMQEGASDAQAKAQQVAPAVSLAVSKSIYATCYYLSYGVVFPTFLVASVIPMNNPIGHGLSDGAVAAKDAVKHVWERRAALKEARRESREQIVAIENGGVAPA